MTDTELLDWLDSLPCGITIHGDAAFSQSVSMTPKQQGFSHTRSLIRQAMRLRGHGVPDEPDDRVFRV